MALRRDGGLSGVILHAPILLASLPSSQPQALEVVLTPASERD